MEFTKNIKDIDDLKYFADTLWANEGRRAETGRELRLSTRFTLDWIAACEAADIELPDRVIDYCRLKDYDVYSYKGFASNKERLYYLDNRCERHKG